MYSESVYYFSKWTFIFTSFLLGSISAGIVYISLLFYPDAWQYSLLFASPLLIVILVLPEYLKILYFLVTNRPALILTKNELIDKFRGKQYKWNEINKIDIELNGGKAPGGHIALYLNNTNRPIRIADIKLRGKKFEILNSLQQFLKQYGQQKVFDIKSFG